MVELTVTIKGIEQTYRQKFLIYEPFVFAYDDPIVKNCIDISLQNAKIEPEDIKIRAFIQVK